MVVLFRERVGIKKGDRSNHSAHIKTFDISGPFSVPIRKRGFIVSD